ncbi:MAG: hypothetical protein WCE35_17340, partial [Bradyrhizobium sp.]
MSRVAELLRWRRAPQVAVLTLMAVGFAGCSADMSTRLSQNQYSNPFASQPEATGLVPAPAVERRELPPYEGPQTQYQSQALPPAAVGTQHSYVAANSGVSRGGGIASYALPQTQYQPQALPPAAVGAQHSYAAANSGVSRGGGGIASYAPPVRPRLET